MVLHKMAFEIPRSSFVDLDRHDRAQELFELDPRRKLGMNRLILRALTCKNGRIAL